MNPRCRDSSATRSSSSCWPCARRWWSAVSPARQGRKNAFGILPFLPPRWGLDALGCHSPSDESLGYFRPSLTGLSTEVNGVNPHIVFYAESPGGNLPSSQRFHSRPSDPSAQATARRCSGWFVDEVPSVQSSCPESFCRFLTVPVHPPRRLAFHSQLGPLKRPQNCYDG